MKIFKTIWMMFCCGQRLAGFEEAESGVCSDCDSPPLSKPLKIHNSNTKYKIQNTNTKAVFVRSAIVILHRHQTPSKYTIQIQNTKYKIQNTKYKITNTKY